MNNNLIPIPKYYWLKQEIISKIENEEWSDSEPIPSERELITLFGVSRITVRKALDELVLEGFLYRIQGKGTFVKNDTVTKQDLFSISSITRDILNMGMTPSRKVLNLDIVDAHKKRIKELEISSSDKLVLVDRIYYADGEPMNRTVVYLPAKYFPGLEKKDLEHESLYDILENEYGVRITSAVRTIEAILAEGEIATMLGIKENVPILLFRGVTKAIVGNREVPIESFKSYYRSDNRRFYINQVNVVENKHIRRNI